MLPYRADLKEVARRLRGQMTEAEQHLWQALRGKQLHGVQFYRQKPLGTYVADFYAPAVKLVVEVDGGQHLLADGLEHDQQRTAYLQSLGLKILRFDNRQVLLERDAVVAVIFEEMRGRL